MLKFLKKLTGPKDPRDAFFAEVEAVLRTLPGYQSSRRVDSLFALDVVTTSGETSRFFLDNLFAETRDLDGEKRSGRIAFVARVVLTSHSPKSEARETFEAVRASLVPVIRGATFGLLSAQDVPGDEPDKAAKAAESSPIRRPFVPFLDLLVVRDTESSMSYVAASNPASWGVCADQIFEAALESLPRLADPPIERRPDGLLAVASHDSYESSRLLLPGFLASFRGKVDGHPIAIIPDRETLLIGGDERQETVERLAAVADEVFAQSRRSVSPALYTCRPDTGAVVPYLPLIGPTRLTVELGHEKLKLSEYERQKRILDQLRTESSPFIASFKLYQRDERLISLGFWTEGLDIYLPETSHVALVVDPGGKSERVVEAPFEAIASRLTKVEGLHPTRYRTGAFPAEAELEAIGSRYGIVRS